MVAEILAGAGEAGPAGLRLYRRLLDRAAQAALLAEVRQVIGAAPPFSPETRRGKAMSVRMTSAGRFGWWSDRRGYRYVDCHPLTGTGWPPIPEGALAVWRAVAPGARMPECCLINLYGSTARMGLHQDRDEADFSQPVVSISLGDTALFRMGGTTRGGRTGSLRLASGDVCVLAGSARLAHHGIDRIYPGTSDLAGDIAGGCGRINLTLRVVT